MKCPDLYCGKQFIVGSGKPELFGRALTQVRGSAYVEGPEMVGDPHSFLVLLVLVTHLRLVH